MKVKPKADTPEDFLQWMTSLSRDQEHIVKKEPFDLTSPMGYPPPFLLGDQHIRVNVQGLLLSLEMSRVKQLMTFGSMR